MAEMDTQDALIAVALVTAISDDRMSDREYEEIVATVDLLPVFRGFDKKRLSGIVDIVERHMARDDGLDAFMGMVRKAVPERLSETAYAIACDVAAADGAVALNEMRLLEVLRHELGLDRLNAAAIERGARARHMRLR